MLLATDSVTQRCLTNNKQAILKLSVFSFTLSVWTSRCFHGRSNINALYVNCYGIHTLTHSYVFLPFDFTARLCMLQSAVPFSMTCAFLPPQWVTVSLPLVYGCVIVRLCIVQ